jgi:hypothetical protein
VGHRLNVRLCVLAVLPAVAMFNGCGASERLGVEGTVTLDGTPLAKGYITFRPQPGTASPSAGANITDGKFSVARKGGLMPGKFRVEITASRVTNRMVRSRLTGKMRPAEEQYIPAKYNSESKLEAEVGASGPHHLEFAVSGHRFDEKCYCASGVDRL